MMTRQVDKEGSGAVEQQERLSPSVGASFFQCRGWFPCVGSLGTPPFIDDIATFNEVNEYTSNRSGPTTWSAMRQPVISASAVGRT